MIHNVIAAASLLSALAFAHVLHARSFDSTRTSQSIDSLIALLRSAEWTEVLDAKEALMTMPEAVPALVELCASTEIAALQNTADLIYPGAKTFYGHGRIVEYDLDAIGVRAGWVLEEMTFQNFGFREGGIVEDSLLAWVRTHPPGDVPLENVIGRKGPRGRWNIPRASAAAAAWWATAAKPWLCVTALEEALASDDPERQLAALYRLRVATHALDGTHCPGYSIQTYMQRLRPMVERLVDATNADVREKARGFLGNDKPKR